MLSPMRFSRAIPLLLAGAAAAWIATRRPAEEGTQYTPPRPPPPEPEPETPDPADQPTTEAPALEVEDAPETPADVTSVVDDLVARDEGEGQIVDADVVDDDR